MLTCVRITKLEPNPVASLYHFERDGKILKPRLAASLKEAAKGEAVNKKKGIFDESRTYHQNTP